MGIFFLYKSVEEKLSLAQEDLISNRNQIGNQNKLIQELKTAKTTLEQEATKKEQQLKEQSAALQDIQKEKVFHFLTKSRILALSWPLSQSVKPLLSIGDHLCFQQLSQMAL